MGTIFKSIGKFFLNIFIIPAFLVGLAFSAVAGFVVFIIELFKKLLRFFTGKNLNSDLPEDIKAKAMIAAAQKQREAALNPVETVQAEIADPIATYRDFARQVATAKAIESKEDVDFMLDDVPLEIDVDVQRRRQPPHAITVERETPSSTNDSNTTAVERYEPKGSKF